MIDNSKMFSHILTCKGRACRLEFNLIIAAFTIPILLLVADIFKVIDMGLTKKFLASDNAMVFFLIYLIAMIYFCLTATVRRNHDLGRKGLTRKFDPKFFKATGQPSSGLEFFLERGTVGPNEYGSDPLGQCPGHK